jgi:hypothetical protein
MKQAKKHLLRTLAAAAEDSVEEAVAEASGYASAEVMRAALAEALFAHPEVKKAVAGLHKAARAGAAPQPKLKPRGKEISKMSGRIQASRLQPRGRER